MPEEFVAGYGAGVQIHVEDLAAILAGRERCDAAKRFDELHSGYEALAAELSFTRRRRRIAGGPRAWRNWSTRRL